METISNFFAAVAALFSWKKKKLDLDNTPELQARAQGAGDQGIKDAAAAEIKSGNLEQIRNDLAE